MILFSSFCVFIYGHEMRSYHLLGKDGGLEGLENFDLNLGSKLLLLGGSSVGKTLGLSEVGADGLEYVKTVVSE